MHDITHKRICALLEKKKKKKKKRRSFPRVAEGANFLSGHSNSLRASTLFARFPLFSFSLFL